MARAVGQRLPDVVRRRGVRQIQQLLAAGIDEADCCEQVEKAFNVSDRTARSWLRIAYEAMSREATAPRAELLGTALRRRRLVMARAAKDGDWKTYLAAADSEAKLLGLNAPVQTEHHVVLSKVQDMSRAVVDVVKDFFSDDPVQRARFVQALRVRLNAQLASRPERVSVVLEGGEDGEAVATIEAGNPTDAVVDAVVAPAADAAVPSPSTSAPVPDADLAP